MTRLNLIILSFFILSSAVWAEEAGECRSLDTREFGLVSDGSIVEPWSEVELIEKYGPPCQIMDMEDVYRKKIDGRITENDSQEDLKTTKKVVKILKKKQFVYKGSYSDRTSVFTIVDGIVVKKERIF